MRQQETAGSYVLLNQKKKNKKKDFCMEFGEGD